MTTLNEIEARVRNCRTYNFGMGAADKLAHEDAPKMLATIRQLENLTKLWEKLGDKYHAQCVRETIERGLNQ